MRIKFIWYKSEVWGDLRPSCVALDAPESFKSCLCNLLVDDGGNPNFSYIDWALIGLAKIESIKEGAVTSEDWSSNSWDALLNKDDVKIMFLYDENFYDIMSIETVEKIIREWVNFIQSEAVLDKTEELIL
jgi:hypothetical protein